MRIVTLNESVKKDILGSLLKRSPNQYTEYEATVNEIVAAVREKGDEAVFDYTKRFDKWDINSSNVLHEFAAFLIETSKPSETSGKLLISSCDIFLKV